MPPKSTNHPKIHTEVARKKPMAKALPKIDQLQASTDSLESSVKALLEKTKSSQRLLPPIHCQGSSIKTAISNPQNPGSHSELLRPHLTPVQSKA